MSPCRILAAFALASLPLHADDTSGAGEWKALFNGRNLDGWTIKIKGQDPGVNYQDTFRVEDGAIKVRYDKYQKFNGEFGHLFYQDQFTNYIIRVEYRFVGEQCPGGPGWAYRNSGIMVHGQPLDTLGKNQDFPVSIEVQLLGGNGKDKRSTANLCTPGTHVVMSGKLVTQHCNDSSSPTYHGDQWVTAEVEVHGSRRIIHRVNGETVLEYEQPQYDPGDADARRLIRGENRLIDHGTISLQAESHPCEFRKVEIKVLPE